MFTSQLISDFISFISCLSVILCDYISDSWFLIMLCIESSVYDFNHKHIVHIFSVIVHIIHSYLISLCPFTLYLCVFSSIQYPVLYTVVSREVEKWRNGVWRCSQARCVMCDVRVPCFVDGGKPFLPPI